MNTLSLEKRKKIVDYIYEQLKIEHPLEKITDSNGNVFLKQFDKIVVPLNKFGYVFDNNKDYNKFMELVVLLIQKEFPYVHIHYELPVGNKFTKTSLYTLYNIRIGDKDDYNIILNLL